MGRSHGLEQVDFVRVAKNGFGDPWNAYAHIDLLRMATESIGFLKRRREGMSHPFGPDVAVRTPTGWTYERNASGGAEVWLAKPAGF